MTVVNADLHDLLLERLRTRFESLKNELGFASSFEELDDIFYLQDSILNSGFVARALERQICARIVDSYMGWNNYLHTLIMPDIHSMIQMNESKLLGDDDKREALRLIGDSMKLVSMNLVIGATRDNKLAAKFIDDAAIFWNETYQPRLEHLMRKVHGGWKK